MARQYRQQKKDERIKIGESRGRDKGEERECRKTQRVEKCRKQRRRGMRGKGTDGKKSDAITTATQRNECHRRANFSTPHSWEDTLFSGTDCIC